MRVRARHRLEYGSDRQHRDDKNRHWRRFDAV
ncbi:Uncharacterised protein [Vibrio cholerae]|nr:Uncharacterised protein [Vibrio cholerae]